MKIVTIGVSGSTEDEFFATLQQAGVDTFCDIRRRRGVRGAKYAFVNRRRLQARLEALGIRYLHLLSLAPSQELRARQKAADKAEHATKRTRKGLSPEFIAGYHQECLGAFSGEAFQKQLGPDARVLALFCVEREPEACHRSLVAKHLESMWGAEIVHLQPGKNAA